MTKAMLNNLNKKGFFVKSIHYVKLPANFSKALIKPQNFAVKTVSNYKNCPSSPVVIGKTLYPRISKKLLLKVLKVEKQVQNLVNNPSIVGQCKEKSDENLIKVNSQKAIDITIKSQLIEPKIILDQSKDTYFYSHIYKQPNTFSLLLINFIRQIFNNKYSYTYYSTKELAIEDIKTQLEVLLQQIVSEGRQNNYLII